LGVLHENNFHRKFRKIRSADSEVEVENKRTGRHTHGHGQHGYLMKLLLSFESVKVG